MTILSRNELAFFEFINSIVGILNLYISIRLLSEYSVLSYLIALLIVWFIQSFILIHLIRSTYSLGASAFFMDIFFLGFLIPYIFDVNPNSDVMVNFSSQKHVLYTLINAIFLFAIGILEKSDMKDSMVYLCYSLMIFQILLLGVIVVLYCKQSVNLTKTNIFISSLTINLTLLCLMQYNDILGVNLVFYYYALYAICFIIVILIKCFQRISIIYGFCFLVFINVIQHNCSLTESILVGMGIICQIIRIVLLSFYAFPLLEKLGKPEMTEYEVTKQISYLLVIFLTILYFYYTIRQFVHSIVDLKNIMICNKEDLQRFQNYLSQNHKYLKCISVNMTKLESYYYSNNTDNLSPLLGVNDDQAEEYDKYNIYFDIYRVISDYKNSNPSIFIYLALADSIIQNPYKIITEIENLHSSIFIKLRLMKPSDLNQVITCRFQNCYIFNESTQLIISFLKGQQSIVITQSLITQTLSTTLFCKLISNELTFSSSQTLYDLFES